MYPNIEAERARNGYSITQLCEKLAIERGTYYNWQRTGNIPASQLIKMAKLFSTSTDYLLGLRSYTA